MKLLEKNIFKYFAKENPEIINSSTHEKLKLSLTQ